MKKPILLPLLTLLFCAVVLFAAALGLNSLGAKNAREAHLELMQTLLPGSEVFTVEPYTGTDANIRSVHKAENGYVVETVTYGYGGNITMYIGVSNEGRVTGLVVWDMAETPGLGAKALTDHSFLSQFLNTAGGVSVGTAEADAFSGATDSVSNEEASIWVDGISGATVTSRAIARSVNSAVSVVTGVDASTGATAWGG